MNQTQSVQELTDRLVSIEKEISILRKEMRDLRQQAKTVPQTITARFAGVCTWADKGEQKHWIKDLFVALSIQGLPVGTKVLQQRMGQIGLTPNELSRSLVEAREE